MRTSSLGKVSIGLPYSVANTAGTASNMNFRYRDNAELLKLERSTLSLTLFIA